MADFISSLNGVQMDAALMDMAEHNSEAWAVGQRNGIDVPVDDVTYHNNAQYYAQQAQSIAPASVTEAVRWDIAQTALTDANKEQARSNIDAGKNGAWSNRNLLDNAYFVGGGSQLGDGVFPINQRGQSSYAGVVNGMDRWRGWTAESTVTLQADGVHITGTGSIGFISFLPATFRTYLQNKTVTLSVLFTDGTLLTQTAALGTADAWIGGVGDNGIRVEFAFASAPYFLIYNTAGQSFGVVAAKLELGTVSTLANDPPPDFEEELRKCQRYLFIYRDGYLGWFYGNGSTMYGIINTPVQLRTTPTVSFTSNGFVSVATGAYVTSAGSFAVDIVNGTTLRMYAALGGAVANGMYLLYLDNGQTLTLSAEL